MLRKKRGWVWLIVIPLILGLAGAGFWWWRGRTPAAASHEEADLPTKPEAPPDLAKFRDTFASGLQAIERKDGADAVKHLSSFDFGSRAVEQYRLYYLARGHELANQPAGARVALARLRAKNPRLVHADQAGLTLGNLYGAGGDWRHAGDAYGHVAVHSTDPQGAATARWFTVESRFYEGDIGGALYAARNIAIKSPRAKEVDEAIAVVRSLAGQNAGETIRLTPQERLERALALLRDGDAATALEELDALAPSAPESMKAQLQLNRGLALHHLRRFEDSNKVLEPLASGPFKTAIPAVYHAAKNYRVVSNSIDPTVYKTVKEKKQVGKVKVRVGKGKKRRTVTKPKFATVSKQIKLIDLAKKNKKDEYNRLATERLKDLLQMPASPPVRLEVLNTLIGIAAAKNQDDYVEELVREAIKVDRTADPGLQHLWDKAWGAYTRGDLGGAQKRLRFIADTYTHPNVRRQSEYWYARSIERAGQKEEAAAIYRRLASAPYEDLYAQHAVRRGAKRQVTQGAKSPDWGDVAEKEMPPELRLAYELLALSATRDAQLEIQKNTRFENSKYANALMADLHHSRGELLNMYRTIRRAYPELATVEQDKAPEYFRKMYYPIKYTETIEKNAKRHNLDPHLVMALILQESYYNPRAKSSVGATGLMQLMPPTARELAGRRYSPAKLTDPTFNIELGTMHLRRVMNIFGNNEHLAVASYNAGQGNVLKWRRGAPGKPMDEFLESIPFDETRNYVKRVTMLKSSYARLTAG